MEQTIITLWQQMFSNNPELANNAAQQMNQIFASSESIILLFNIVNSSPDFKIKRYSIVNIYSLLKRHRDSIPREVFINYSQQLINFLQTELDINTKMIICDSLIENQYYFSNLQFSDFVNITLQLLNSQNPNFPPVGIYLISYLIDAKHFGQIPMDVYQFLINSSLQLLQQPMNLNATSNDIFNICYKCFENLIPLIDANEVIMSSFSLVAQYIQQIFQIVYTPEGIKNKDDSPFEAQSKVSKYFILVSKLIQYQPNYFANNFSPMLPAINAKLVDRNVDINTRLSSLRVISSSAGFLPDLIINDLSSYIMNTALFAIESLETNQDLQSINEPSDIYQEICKNMIEEMEPAEILNRFIPAIQALKSMNTPSSLIAIFMIFENILSFCIEAIIESFDSIQPLIVMAISTGVPLILEMVSSFIINLCNEDNSIACIILFSCEQGLLRFVQHDFVLNALREIYDFSMKEPKDSKLSFTCLIQQLSSTQDRYHIEKVIECISYLILTVDSVIPEYFTQIRPFLIQLLQSKDTSCMSQAIFCFSTFANKSANFVKNDIPQLVQSILSGISQKDMSFDQICATTVSNLVDIYPQSFAPFCPQVLPALISILNDQEFYIQTKNLSYEIEDDELEKEEVNEKQKKLNLYSCMRNDIYSAIATIFGTYAQQLAGQSDQILQVITSSVTGGNLNQDDDDEELLSNLDGFYKSLTEIIPGFLKINKDPDQLIQLFFQSRKKFELYANDRAVCVTFYDSLKIIISKCGPSFLLKYGNDILNIITEIFVNSGNWDLYSQTKKRFVLRKEFIVPITTLVGRFFHDFGGNGWLCPNNDMTPAIVQFAGKGIELMNNLIKTTKIAQAPASSAIAHIIASCNNNQQFNNLVSQVLNIVFPQLINSKIGDTREHAYDTISILLYTGNTQAVTILGNNSCITNIISSTQEVMTNEGKYQKSLVSSATICWCAVVMIYNVPISQENLENALQFLPPEPFTPMLEFVAQFAAYASGKWPTVFNAECLLGVGLSIFISTDNYIRNVKLEYMKMLSDVIKNTPQEKIFDELHYDENSISTLQNHVQQVDSYFS